MAMVVYGLRKIQFSKTWASINWTIGQTTPYYPGFLTSITAFEMNDYRVHECCRNLDMFFDEQTTLMPWSEYVHRKHEFGVLACMLADLGHPCSALNDSNYISIEHISIVHCCSITTTMLASRTPQTHSHSHKFGDWWVNALIQQKVWSHRMWHVVDGHRTS